MAKRKAQADLPASPSKAPKPASVMPPAQEGQVLQEPFVDLSTYTKISQGAEAVSAVPAGSGCLYATSRPALVPSAQKVWAGTFLDRPAVVKQRFSKKYRTPALDFRLNTSRLKQVPLSMSALIVYCPASLRS